MSKTKLYKLANTSLNLVLASALFFSLWYLLESKMSTVKLSYLTDFFSNFSILALLSLLTIANWAIEAIKWKGLMNPIHQLSVRETIGSILVGISANLIAPNRTGDLAGRLSFIPKKNIWQALYINFFSAASQLMITLIVGLMALLYFIDHWSDAIQIEPAFFIILIAFSFLICIYLYFKSQLLSRIFIFFKKGDENRALRKIEFNSRLICLLLSTARYLIFLLQFYIVLKALHVQISFIQSSMSLAFIFLVNSFIPSNMILELLSKGAAVYFAFELLQIEPLYGVCATFILWLFNIGLPSLFGIYFLKDLNWFSNHQIKKEVS